MGSGRVHKRMGKFDMPDTSSEVEWRAEFDRIGEDQARNLIYAGIIPEPKRQFGFHWLGEQARARNVRELRLYRYAKWTFVAAVAAVIVGVVGVLVTLLH